MEKKLTVFCDIDGVIRNLITGVCKVAGKTLTDDIYNSVKEWNQELFGKKMDEYIKNPLTFILAEPYDNAFQFVKFLNENYNLFFLTSQNFNSEILKANISWLEKNGFLGQTKGLFFVTTGKDKIYFLNRKNTILIDDNPLLVEILGDRKDLFSVKRPWNLKGKYETFSEIKNAIKSFPIEE